MSFARRRDSYVGLHHHCREGGADDVDSLVLESRHRTGPGSSDGVAILQLDLVRTPLSWIFRLHRVKESRVFH